MKKQFGLQHKFVENIPDDLEAGYLYVSVEYATAVHLCCCGCGTEVVTPLTPTDWRLIFDGETVSLSPSIGNWNFPCSSHYWIRNNQVHWAQVMSAEKIAEGRKKDRERKDQYFKRNIVDGSKKHRTEG